jgi:hypothetical protein
MRLVVCLFLLQFAALASEPARLVATEDQETTRYQLVNSGASPIIGYVLRFEKMETGKAVEKVFKLRSFAPTPAAPSFFGVPVGATHDLPEANAVITRLGPGTRVSLDAVLFADNSSFGPDEHHQIPYLRGMVLGFRGGMLTIQKVAREVSAAGAVRFADQVLTTPPVIRHP